MSTSRRDVFKLLINGKEIPIHEVFRIGFTIDKLSVDNYFHFIKQCQSPAYKLPEITLNCLRELALARGGEITEDARNVMLHLIKTSDPERKHAALATLYFYSGGELENLVFSMKMLHFLAKNKYTLLIAAVIGYGLYDYTHGNRIGERMKNGLFNLWKKATDPSEKKEDDQYQLSDIGISFVGP